MNPEDINFEERHHYIPRFLLKGFAAAKADVTKFGNPTKAKRKHVWVFNKKSKGWELTDTTETAAIRGYYIHPGRPDRAEPPTDDIERIFGEIESPVSVLIDKVVRHKHRLDPESGDFGSLVSFLALQFGRSPRNIEGVAHTVRTVSQELLKAHELKERYNSRLVPSHRFMFDDDVELGDFFVKVEDEVGIEKRSCWGIALSVVPKLADILCTFGWLTLRAPKGKHFVIGDSSVAIAVPGEPMEFGGGIANPLAEVSMPLSADTALVGFQRRDGVGDRFQWRNATPEEVDCLNARQVITAVTEVYAKSSLGDLTKSQEHSLRPIIDVGCGWTLGL